MNITPDTEIWFGGSFDPVHNGHLITARFVAETVGAKKVVLVPASCSPLKNRTSASAEDRLEMLKLAVSGNDLFEVSDIELQRSPPSYTIETIEQAVRKGKGQGSVALLIGADALEELPSWHRMEELLGMVQLLIACRPPMSPSLVRDIIFPGIENRLGSEIACMLEDGVIPTPLIDISSTEIRRRRESAMSVRYLVPGLVEEYICNNRIYV